MHESLRFFSLQRNYLVLFGFFQGLCRVACALEQHTRKPVSGAPTLLGYISIALMRILWNCGRISRPEHPAVH
ncbi:hypothetical protein BC936DRAFT_148442 [Jimgerdemannia flammicorona]|uniref:Uncharacterized protein n=1 Tax=Jimgerdemannia flammicorona TaxID=994334 RepID=A0A433D307_9FUNG|nr:hypothetical protein BC936DRAFT_148442 [Jimgerdemannia flammicorona]